MEGLPALTLQSLFLREREKNCLEEESEEQKLTTVAPCMSRPNSTLQLSKSKSLNLVSTV